MQGKAKYAYEIIKNKIMEGELTPLSDVSEEQLYKELNVSRTPVREALLKLEKECFVNIYPRKGIIVADVTIDLIYEIYTLRELNEPYIAKSAARAVPRKWLLEMKEAMLQFPQEFNDRQASRHFIDLDRKFHSELLDYCPNRFIKVSMAIVYDHMHLIRLRTFDLNTDNDKCNDEHIAIIDAMLEKNEQKIEEAVEYHIENFKNIQFGILSRRHFK